MLDLLGITVLGSTELLDAINAYAEGNLFGQPDQLEEHLAPADMGFMGDEQFPMPLWDPFGALDAELGDDLE